MEYARKIQTLGGAKLYAWLLENGKVSFLTDKAEMLYKTGIGSNDTLMIGRRELEALGVMVCKRLGRSSFQITLKKLPEYSGVVLSLDTEDESLMDRCLLADAMDDEGSPQDPKSNYNKKRKKQIELVKEIFRTYFPEVTERYPLHDGGAKELLRAQPYTQEILDTVELLVTQAEQSGKPINAPLGYVKTTLLKRRANGETSIQQAGAAEELTQEQKELKQLIDTGAFDDFDEMTTPWAKYEVGGDVNAN